jgi:hypothetical protein
MDFVQVLECHCNSGALAALSYQGSKYLPLLFMARQGVTHTYHDDVAVPTRRRRNPIGVDALESAVYKRVKHLMLSLLLNAWRPWRFAAMTAQHACN